MNNVLGLIDAVTSAPSSLARSIASVASSSSSSSHVGASNGHGGVPHSHHQQHQQNSSFQNYQLFNLVRILGIKSAGLAPPVPIGSSTSSSANNSRKGSVQDAEEEDTKVTIQCIAAGGFQNRALFAVYCSNNYLIFRFVGEGGVPVVRHLAWFRDPNKKILSMCFKPSAKWLICATADASIILIPVFYLMCRKEEGGSSNDSTSSTTSSSSSSSSGGTGKHLGSLTDVTIINSNRTKLSHCSHVLWWRTWDRGSKRGDYAVISSLSGSLTFIDLRSAQGTRVPEVCSFKLKHPIAKMDLLTGPGQSYKYLLLHTQGGGCWKLILEQETQYHTYETIIGHAGKAPFVPYCLTRFPATTSFSSHVTKQGNIIGAYNPSSSRLEAFDDPDANRFPMFVYQLFPGKKSIVITDKLIFASHTDEEGRDHISVISSLVAGTSAAPHVIYKAKQESIMQEFVLPPGQSVLGVFRSFPTQTNSEDLTNSSNNNNKWTSGSSSSGNSSSGEGTGTDGEGSYSNRGTSQNAETNGDGENGQGARLPEVTPTSLEGFFFWTADAVYECRPKLEPERIFFRLLSEGLARSHAEVLGKTLGLDLLALYEIAADKYFEMGDYGRALELYFLSNVRTSKLVQKFMGIDRIDIVIMYLRSGLQQPGALSVGDRKRLADTLFRCYVMRCLTKVDTPAIYDKDLRSFLKKNSDYDENKAMGMLLHYGMIRNFLLVAEVHSLVPQALRMLTNRGVLNLTEQDLKLLVNTGQLESAQSCGQGVLFRVLPPKQQVKLILDNFSNLHPKQTIRRLYSLLHTLEEPTLVKLAELFDPMGEHMVKILCYDHSLTNATGPEEDDVLKDPISSEEYMEFFLTVLVSLIYRRKHSGKFVEPLSAALPLSTSVSIESRRQEKKVASVSCGWNHTCVITEAGEVYSWGRNAYGGLGHGDVKVQMTPRRVEALRGKKISQVACGGDHTFVIEDNGKTNAIYSFGSSLFGQLAHGDRKSHSTPRLVETLPKNKRIISVACGYNHTALLTDSGELFTCGSGEHGELGHGSKRECPLPLQVEAISGGCAVACGCAHTVLLTDRGDVYSWGNGLYGQLGHPTLDDHLKPKLIEGLQGKRIKQIACGSFHTVAITDLGGVCSWGKGSRGRLGHGDVESYPTPKLIDALVGKRTTRMACGAWHSIATTANGTVFSWGSGDSGQLGHGDIEEHKVPTPVASLKSMKMIDIRCGEHFTVALADTGKLYSWGSGEFGQLGLGDARNCLLPTQVEIYESFDIRVSNETSSSRELSSPKDDNGVFFGQGLFEATLKRQFKVYRPTIMLQRCIDWENWQAAGLIYELMGDASEALECTLMGLAKSYRLEKNLIAQNVLGLLGMFIQRHETLEGKANLLLQVLEFWREQTLSLPVIEEYLLENLETTALPLTYLLENNYDGCELPLLLPFTHKLYLQISLYQQTSQESLEREKTTSVSEETLWSHIRENLEKDLTKRETISIARIGVASTLRSQLQTPSSNNSNSSSNNNSSGNNNGSLSNLPGLGPSSSSSSSSDQKDAIAFSCSHVYSRRFFFNVILPQFDQRVSSFHPPIPATQRLFVDDFHQRFVNLACPVCLYNSLLQELPDNKQQNARPWEV